MDEDVREALRTLAEAVQAAASAVTAVPGPLRSHGGVKAAHAQGLAQRVLDRLGPF